MAWRIELTDTAAKQLAELGKPEAKRIAAFLRDRLAPLDDPRSLGSPLSGTLAGLWRYRIGDYRLICALEEGVMRILVVTIGHRRDVYR